MLQSAEGWIRDFHLDGLRLDAVHAIFDGGAVHLVQALNARVHAVDPLLISVVRSLGGKEKDLYFKVIIPSVLPYVVAAARIAVGRALIGVLVAEFFAASEGIGYAIERYGNFFAMDRMFGAILAIMVIAIAFTEGIRWAERTAFPWRVGR